MLKKFSYGLIACLFVIGLATWVGAGSMPGVDSIWAPTGQYIGPFGNKMRSTPAGFTLPTTNACGTNTINGTDSVMSIVISAGTPATCAINFGVAWANAPVCWYNDQTTANANGGKILATTALFTITLSTFTGAVANFGADTINVLCMAKA